MQINFYQTNDILHKSIAPILLKILEEGKRALILSKNQDLLTQIDDGLWSFSKTKFVPHGTKNDKITSQNQPIFLSSIEENSNNASYLIFLDKPEDKFITSFDKNFYFFNDDNKKEAQNLWLHYKKLNYKLNFFKKESDKWTNTGSHL